MSKRALAIISTLAAAPAVALLSLAGPANAATPSPGYFSETTSSSARVMSIGDLSHSGWGRRLRSDRIIGHAQSDQREQQHPGRRDRALDRVHRTHQQRRHLAHEVRVPDQRLQDRSQHSDLGQRPDEQNQYSLQLVAVRGRQHRSGQLPRSDGGSGLQQLLTHGPWHARSEGLRPQPSWRTAVGTMRRLLHDVAG